MVSCVELCTSFNGKDLQCTPGMSQISTNTLSWKDCGAVICWCLTWMMHLELSSPNFHQVNLSAPLALASLPCPPAPAAGFLQRAKVLQELMLHAYTSSNPLSISWKNWSKCFNDLQPLRPNMIVITHGSILNVQWFDGVPCALSTLQYQACRRPVSSHIWNWWPCTTNSGNDPLLNEPM